MLSIQPDSQTLTVPDAVNNTRYVIDGLTYQIDNLVLKYQEFKKFVKFIEKEPTFNKLYDYSPTQKSLAYHINLTDAIMDCSGTTNSIFFTIFATSEDALKKYWDMYKSFKECNDDIDVIYDTYFMNNGRLESNSKMLDMKEFKSISSLYYPYINTNVLFNRFFTGAENVLIVVGEPGLGKSKLSSMAIKHAYENSESLPYDKVELTDGMDDQYVSIVFVKSPEVLSIDSFWSSIETSKPDIVIIDDLDYMLTKRDAEVTSVEEARKNSFLNQFLTFTDGVEKNNTKFIITTNQSFENIDSAALRKGRLFDILELRKLTNDEALHVWKENELDIDTFTKIFTSKHVLQADLGSEITNRLNKRNKSLEKSYLREDGISKLENAKNHKTISIL